VNDLEQVERQSCLAHFSIRESESIYLRRYVNLINRYPSFVETSLNDLGFYVVTVK
jgi:hypothetical protein